MNDGAVPSAPVPVVLVAGGLGAGKTSLINAVLRADHGMALAVVVNDFGAINIDEAILSATGLPVYGLKNGCICCSLQGDLLRTLRLLLSVGRPLDGILIEASGVSDPRGILEALCDPVLRASVRLDAVVGVVDAQAHDASDDLWRAQVRAADMVVLSKTGAADADGLARLRETLASMGKALVVTADAAGGVPPDLLFGGRIRRLAAEDATGGAPIRDERFLRLDWTSPAPLLLPRFQAAIEALAPQLARAKGFLAFVERPGDAFLFQMVGRRASLEPVRRPVQGAELVLIGPRTQFDPARAAAVLDAVRAAGGGDPQGSRHG
ncbi:MAG: GTP-binding protein [Rhizobiales bacterium]|nr:GTP-binding protein [Hyphomicrobiales bacterium]